VLSVTRILLAKAENSMLILVLTFFFSFLAVAFFHDILMHFFVSIFLFIIVNGILTIIIFALQILRKGGVVSFGKAKELYKNLFRKKAKVDIDE
jgi:hypothetical protein